MGGPSQDEFVEYTINKKDSKVNLSAFIYRLFHENFSSIIGTNTVVYSQPSTCLYAVMLGGIRGPVIKKWVN